MARDVGDYRIEELIGYGGCGEVWRARHRRTGESVALKWLRGTDRVGWERHRREAALLAAVSHPHLARLLGVLSDHGEPVLVLDHLAGGSLTSLLARRRRLPAGEVVSIIAPLAAALAYAHDEGLVHADVTPGNVLFTAGGRPVLTDLGIARVIGEGEDGAGVQGTPEYVDPAVALGAVPGPASDVFGLAAVAFHALTGIPPWNAAGTQATLAVAAGGVLPSLRELAPDAPDELVDVLCRALSAEPRLRGSAADLALDVRHACTPEPVGFDVDTRGVLRRPAATSPVTQGVRIPRADGPAHADPTPPRWSGRAAQVVRMRGRGVLAVLTALLAIGAAVVVGAQWGADDGPQTASAASAPAGTPGAGSGAGAEEFAVPQTDAGWQPLLSLLYQRRATAFGQADTAALMGVYTESSPQAAADRDEIDRLRLAGLRIDDFVPEVLSVVSARGSAPAVTVVVQDSYGPYTVVDSAQGVRSYAGRAATQVRLALRLTDAGWRIESAVRLADPG